MNKAYLVLCAKCGHPRFQHGGQQCRGKCKVAVDINVTNGATRRCSCPHFIQPSEKR